VNHVVPKSSPNPLFANATAGLDLNPQEYKTLELKLEDGLLLVGLNRPKQLNTVSDQMIAELHRLFDWLQSRPHTRVVILYGNGKAFCAGLDLVQDPALFDTMWKAMKFQRSISSIFVRMRRLPQVFISAVHGATCGAGLALALASDLRIAGETSRFNVAMRKIGMTGCDIGISYFLPRIVGASLATEMMLTGEFIAADKALSSGLVSRVVPDDNRLAVAKDLAIKMLNTSPLGLNMTKEGLNFSIDAPSLEAAVAMEDRQQAMMVRSGDFEAGIAAFLAKQPAKFEQLS